MLILDKKNKDQHKKLTVHNLQMLGKKNKISLRNLGGRNNKDRRNLQ